MLRVNARLAIPEREIVIESIRARGPGGQNVNRVASAVHLRFDVPASSLPDNVKQRLLALRDSRISSDGVVVIKAGNHRTRERNRQEALSRLADLVRRAARVPRRRIPTRPGKAAKERRIERKKRRGALKRQRATRFEE